IINKRRDLATLREWAQIELVFVSCYPSLSKPQSVKYEHPSRDPEFGGAAAAERGRGVRLLRTPGQNALRELSRRLAAHTQRPPQARLQRLRVRANRG